MDGSGSARRTQLIDKLPQLQNLVKRDPDGYRDEFMMQYRHYESARLILELEPNSETATPFVGLVSFLSHVAKCYPDVLSDFPEQIMTLLIKHHAIMDHSIRKSLTQSLILLRNRELIAPARLLHVFFELFHCQDKKLRDMVYHHILSDLKNINKTSVNQNTNRSLQTFLYKQVQTGNELTSRIALQLLIEMYRKRIWTDARTINVIAETACTSKMTRLVVMAIQFFLGIEHDILADDEEDEKKAKEQVEVDYHLYSKKTKKRHRQTRKQLLKNKKARTQANKANQPLFPAIQLIHDPQTLAERLLRMIKGPNERFEVKLLIMNFVSRIVGCHRLIVLNFYSLLQRYLNSHQKNVTNILAFLVQASHDQIPPEELLAVVKTICNNFITERCDSMVISVGMNTIREVFVRVPLILECEGMDALIDDFIMYNKSKDKSVVIAARSVLNAVRELYPALLKRKNRGKHYDATARPAQYGELVPAQGVEGADLLEAAEAAGRFDADENEDEWQVTSEEEEEGDDDGDEWINVEEEEEEEEEVEQPQDTETNETTENPKPQNERIDARRILTQRDFERIELLKKEAKEAAKDPKRRSRKRQEVLTNAKLNHTVNPEDLEGYAKKRRQTQEERMLSVLKGREEFQHRKSGGGTTNAEKNRKKHFLMLRKSRSVQDKIRLSARQVQHQKNKAVKKVLKHDKKKRRRL